MDTLNNSTLRQKCLETYGDLESSNATGRTIFISVALPFLAIGLELVSNWIFTCEPGKQKKEEEEEEEAESRVPDSPSESSVIPLTDTVSEQPQPQPEPQAEPQPTSGDTVSKDTDANFEEKMSNPIDGSCCVDARSPHVRANRLLCAIFLYALVLAAFILRIRDATTAPNISTLCQPVIHPWPPSWAVIAILVILPFAGATTAFLRTLVDCVLVRWGKALTIEPKEEEGTCFWAPAMPLLVVGVVVWLLVELCKVPIAWIMGEREVSIWTQKRKKGKGRVEDVEMQGVEEEMQGLVENVDGPREGESEGVEPPAYDEVCGASVAVEGKPAVDV